MTLTLHRFLTLVAIAVSAFVLLALMVLVGPGRPCAQGLPKALGTPLAPRTVDELTAARIEILVLKRQVIEEHAARAAAESTLTYAELGRTLDTAIEAAARHDGLDPARYRLDLATRTWKQVMP